MLWRRDPRAGDQPRGRPDRRPAVAAEEDQAAVAAEQYWSGRFHAAADRPVGSHRGWPDLRRRAAVHRRQRRGLVSGHHQLCHDRCPAGGRQRIPGQRHFGFAEECDPGFPELSGRSASVGQLGLLQHSGHHVHLRVQWPQRFVQQPVLVAHPGEQHEPDHSRVRRGIPLPHVGRLGHRPGAGQPGTRGGGVQQPSSPATGLRQARAVLQRGRGSRSVQDPEAGQRRAAARLHRIRTRSVQQDREPDPGHVSRPHAEGHPRQHRVLRGPAGSDPAVGWAVDAEESRWSAGTGQHQLPDA